MLSEKLFLNIKFYKNNKKIYLLKNNNKYNAESNTKFI